MTDICHYTQTHTNYGPFIGPITLSFLGIRALIKLTGCHNLTLYFTSGLKILSAAQEVTTIFKAALGTHVIIFASQPE